MSSIGCWIDAENVPRGVRMAVFRIALKRSKVRGVMVVSANKDLLNALSEEYSEDSGESKGVPSRVVPVEVEQGFDSADDYITEYAVAGDIVVTDDRWLADQLLDRGCAVLDARGFAFRSPPTYLMGPHHPKYGAAVARPKTRCLRGQTRYTQADLQRFCNLLGQTLDRSERAIATATPAG